TALSVCRRFPGLVERDMEAFSLLERIVERPFAFLSGSKLKWWERCIYKLIRVYTDSAHDSGREKQKVNGESTTKEDEENPPESSKVSSLSEQHCSSSCNYKSITKYISFYFMRYIRRVPLIRRLYDQKSMHENAVALTKYLLTQINKKGMDEENLKDMFLLYKVLETAMKFGTTEFVLECLRAFPFLCLDDTEGD
ncbi:hypothetical protein MKW94_010446, partial [Papaver nudicaule]|nr:hypothetical protein [Papaver nudicaule]